MTNIVGLFNHSNFVGIALLYISLLFNNVVLLYSFVCALKLRVVGLFSCVPC